MIWSRQPNLDELNRNVRGTLVEHLGIVFSALDEGSLSATMPVDRRTHQPAGLLHGGASAALAETIGSYASWLVLGEGNGHVVGVEINASHLRGVTEGLVTGVARPLRLGRTLHVWDIRIADAAGEPVCVARLTVAIIPHRRRERAPDNEVPPSPDTDGARRTLPPVQEV